MNRFIARALVRLARWLSPGVLDPTKQKRIPTCLCGHRAFFHHPYFGHCQRCDCQDYTSDAPYHLP